MKRENTEFAPPSGLSHPVLSKGHSADARGWDLKYNDETG